MLNFKRLCAMCLTVAMATSCLAGCSKIKQDGTKKTGEVLKLDMWQMGGGYYKGKVQDNIVKKAVTEATGVEITNIIYSGQMDDFEKFNLLYGANQLPAVLKLGIYGKEPLMIEKLEKEDSIWEYTEDDLKKYAPDLYKAVGEGAFKIVKRPNGKIAEILGGCFDTSEYWKQKYPEWYKNYGPINNNGDNKINVREDVLKQYFPNTKTYNEIKTLVDSNKLTYNDVKTDDLIVDWDSFVKFLYDVKASTKTTPILWGSGNGVVNGFARMFFQSAIWWDWNPITGKSNQMQIDHASDFNKLVNDVNKMYNDGIFDKDFAIIKNEQVNERALTGKYPILKAGPSVEQLNLQMQKDGKPMYRPVYIAYNKGDNVFNGYARSEQDRAPYAFVFNKKKISKEDLPKVLGYLNYFAKDEGLKMLTWGPKNSGLWEETNGKRQWKDPEFVKVLKAEKPTGQMKDFEYYGIFGLDRKYYQDEFWAPMHEWSSTMPYYPTFDRVPTVSSAIDRVVAQNNVKGVFSDPYSFWNTQTTTNTDFWAGINEYQDYLIKAVMSKDVDGIKTNMDKAQDVLKTKMKVDAYRAEQSKFVDFIKNNKSNYKLHPEQIFAK